MASSKLQNTPRPGAPTNERGQDDGNHDENSDHQPGSLHHLGNHCFNRSLRLPLLAAATPYRARLTPKSKPGSDAGIPANSPRKEMHHE